MKYDDKKCSTIKKNHRKNGKLVRNHKQKEKYYQGFTFNVNSLNTPIKRQRLSN